METFWKILLGIAQILFSFWPFLLFLSLNGVTHQGHSLGRIFRFLLRNTLVIWSILAVFRAALLLTGLEPIRLFPEPASSLIFLAVGLFLIPIQAVLVRRDRSKVRRDLENAHTLADLQALSPTEFEELVAETYRTFGHHAEVVGATGDHGIDLVVRAANGEKWVVQCKRYRGVVGEPVVRDFFGAMQHEHAEMGSIITTGRFTAQAVEWAQGKPIRLHDGEDFVKVVIHAQEWKRDGRKPEVVHHTPSIPVAPLQTAAVAISSSSPMPPLCPRCGLRMVLRTVTQGEHRGKQFYGCPNAPHCDVIRPVR